jgi:Uma2 family endonuclease
MGAREDPLFTARHRLTVDDYYRMSELGLLDPWKKTELIDGEIIEVNSMNSRHAGTVNRLNRLLHDAVGNKALISSQTPVRLSTRSEPQPDLMVLKPRRDEYVDSHPVPADVLLVIEVADSSARLDREIKVPLYARHGIAELWLVDLDASLFRRHRKPVKGAHLEVETTPTPGVLPLPGLSRASIDLSGILG